METNSHRVQLDVFEGPLDLLLHLIKKDDLNIYDIPISHLLEQYTQYIELAKELDIDLAGEFLEMAAELAYIKSKMLLPEPQEEEEEGPDPRAELMKRLLEYQRFKMAGQSLLSRPLLGQDVFSRTPEESEEEAQEVWVEADTLSLVSAFHDILKRLPQEKVHEISHSRMGVAERILELTDLLRGKDRVSFEDLFQGGKSRSDLVVTFLAILEMAKQRLLRIAQEKVFCKIVVCPLFSADGNSEAGEMGGQNGNETTEPKIDS